ncbi:hypothetical protein PT2222_100179 [Paraburkholderia tropica]
MRGARTGKKSISRAAGLNVAKKNDFFGQTRDCAKIRVAQTYTKG